MRSGFAPVKRPLLALVCLAALLATMAITPAQAVVHNNLSMAGTQGRIRVRSVFQERTGATQLQRGDQRSTATNPNRTVGDVPAIKGNQYAAGCAPFSSDCLRTLAPNDPTVNPSAADGHAHYHTGDKFVIVNEVSGFRRGDTVLIGSPYCNFPTLGATCKKFIPGFGLVNEQPVGEVANVVGGDVNPGDKGVGVLELGGSGLANTVCFTASLYGPCAYEAGTQISKLETLYQGQQFRVDINHTDLLDCDTTALPPISCNPNDVAVSATFLPPQGAHDPSFPTRPLALNRDNMNGPFAAVVPATCGPATCGAGHFSFYIPKEITGTATIGRTFNVETPDTWYTVEVTAKDTVTGAVVADGVVRFKLNTVSIVGLKAENPQQPGDNTFFPGESVEITGGLRDNTSAPALAARPVEDVIVDVTVTRPDGSDATYGVTSCVDTDPTPADQCGGNVFRSQPDGHGKFLVTFGGPQGVFIHFIGTNSTCNGPSGPSAIEDLLLAPLNLIDQCVLTPVLSITDTLDTGTYDVEASIRGYSPPVTATTSFDVILI